MKTLAIAALLTIACAPPLPDQWSIEGEAPAHVAEALRVAQERAPCDVGPWGGTIHFVTESVPCGDAATAHGCAWQDDDGPHVVVVASATQDAADTPLMHELGHIAWGRCGRIEHEWHPVEFIAWVSWANLRLLGVEFTGP